MASGKGSTVAQFHPYYEKLTLVGLKQKVIENELTGRFSEFRIYPDYNEETMLAQITHERRNGTGFGTEYQITDLEFGGMYVLFETVSQTLSFLDGMIDGLPAEQLAKSFDYASKA